MAVPKLRFKEFDEDWTLTTLNQLSTKIGDGIHATPKYDESGTIPFINGNNLVNGRIAINENTKRISSEEFQKYNQILSDRTLFLSINGTIGNLAFYKNEKVLLGKSVCFINLKNDLDKKFIYLLLQSPQLTKTLNSELTGTTIKNLSLATVRNSEFYCPIEAEQTKIASFLSAVDEKISQLTQKHELLSQYKQGMMQKLFSQQIRFKADDGSEFGEWDKVPLGDCVDILTNGLSLDQNTNGDGFQVTRIETISNFNIDLNRVGYVDTQSDISSYKLVIGDILFSNINSISHIGKVVYVDKDYDIYHGMNLLRIQFKRNLDKKFMFYQLSQKKFKQHFETIANKAVNQASINQTALKKTELCTPCLEEQIKIATFLSAIDQKIEVVAQQLKQAKQWKKGLLQQMFV